jgi:hypothetical protein
VQIFAHLFHSPTDVSSVFFRQCSQLLPRFFAHFKRYFTREILDAQLFRLKSSDFATQGDFLVRHPVADDILVFLTPFF